MKKNYIYLLLFCFLSTGLSAQVVWDNFEDSRKGVYGFINGSLIPYTENPAPGGSNTSRVVASYTRNAAELFDVILLDAAMADLSDYLSGTKTMSMDVWSPAAGSTIQITLENQTLAQPANFPTGRHSAYLATTTVAMGWETLTFSFDNQPDAAVANDNVDRIVILFEPNTNNGTTFYWDNFNGPELADDPCANSTANPEVFNDFECNQNTDFVFSHSGINFRRVTNPDQNGNTSDVVATYTRNGGEEFDVIIGFFDGNLGVTNKSINLDVWDPTAPTDVVVSLQNESNDVILEMRATTSVSNAWQTLSFDPTPVAAATDIAKFVILFDPESFTSDQYYFDNFGFGETVGIVDLDQITDFVVSPNPTQGFTTFQYDLQSSAQVNLAIHDLTGKVVAQLANEKQASGSHQIDWVADQVANGMYFYTLTVDGDVATGKIMLNR